MSKRSEILLLNDIIQGIENIFEYTENMSFEDFNNDNKTKDAVVRNFEIIGEAAKLISDDTRNKFPLVEWRELNDFRNKLIHEYFGVDYEIVWDVIRNELPTISVFIRLTIK